MIKFDVVSHLRPDHETLLRPNPRGVSYCVVAGCQSNDIAEIIRLLGVLAANYSAVFYQPGTAEYEDHPDIMYRTDELAAACGCFDNVVMMTHSLSMFAGIGIIGINGWGHVEGSSIHPDTAEAHRDSDHDYLEKAVSRLQLYRDVRKIIIVTAVPPTEEWGGEIDLTGVLRRDTGKKVQSWVFAGPTVVDTTIGGIHYSTTATEAPNYASSGSIRSFKG